MFPKLKISEFLLKRLERVKQQCSGCLFGVFYGDGTLLLMGFNVESTIGQLNYEQIQHKFPAELDLCGLVKFGDCTDAEAHLTEIFKDVDITDNPILLHCELGTLVGLRASIYMHGKLQKVPYEVMQEQQLFDDFCFTRLRCTLNIYTEPNVQAVRKEMNALRKILSGGSLAFNIEATKIYITNAGVLGRNGGSGKNNTASITNESYIKDILAAISNVLAAGSGSSNKENNKKRNTEVALSSIFGAVGCDYDVFNIAVLRCKTRERTTLEATEASGDNNQALPAMYTYLRSEENKLCIPLEVEAMAVLSKQTKVVRLYDILIESICRGLRLCEQSLTERLEEHESSQLSIPRVHHFYNTDIGHFLSCSYLDGISDDNANMQEKRKRLHRHFGLPVMRPYFRRTNRCIFHSELPEDSPLMNTHVGLRGSGVVEGKTYLVQGNYQYYHYMQQQVQDKGWGCAYRSFQTICSWFQLQGYTERAIPTHREIQKHLAAIGDKPKTFVGSTQWIGSTEISMCLQGFLTVDSKILHVSSGNELATMASELATHFQTQGTPIMIGGGVLAHTIIGVDYCVQTGELKFLILDPHYTGADDLQIIQSKGWCGWKSMDFWDKKSYYNLCLPQRPIMI